MCVISGKADISENQCTGWGQKASYTSGDSLGTLSVEFFLIELVDFPEGGSLV